MAIICTQNDKEFNEYKERISNRNVIYHIKDIFGDNWNNFLNKFPKFSIGQTVFDNVKRMIKCKTLELGFDIYNQLNRNNKSAFWNSFIDRMIFTGNRDYDFTIFLK